MVSVPAKRKLTVDDYHRMGEAGIFGYEERVELLDGELYEMAPIGEGHNGGVLGLNHRFGRQLNDRAIVSVQGPLRLTDYSEPEPDLMLLQWRPDFYRTAKPRPEDVLLLIEVAETSLNFDRGMKLPRYAAAGIPEVWIVNLVARVVEVYREPSPAGYAVTSIHGRGDTLAPSAFPDVTIRVDEILG